MKFMVGFFCDSENLVIEIDGGIHLTQQDQDPERQKILEE
jgi:very-short-patch-repair endonuclease